MRRVNDVKENSFLGPNPSLEMIGGDKKKKERRGNIDSRKKKKNAQRNGGRKVPSQIQCRETSP